MADEHAKRLKELNRLANRVRESFSERLKKLDAFSENNPSRMVFSVYAEVSAHQNATIATCMELYKELSHLVATTNAEGEKVKGLGHQVQDIHKTIDATVWTLAIQALETCVAVAKLSEAKELLELAWLIADKSASLFGGEYVKLVFELITAIREGKDARNIRDEEARKAGVFLAELELFMWSSLAANQYAVAQIHRLTRPTIDSGSKSREEREKMVGDEARNFVSEKIRQARGEAKVWMRFPEDGFWIDAPPF
jgi:hypothetical protein